MIPYHMWEHGEYVYTPPEYYSDVSITDLGLSDDIALNERVLYSRTPAKSKDFYSVESFSQLMPTATEPQAGGQVNKVYANRSLIHNPPDRSCFLTKPTDAINLTLVSDIPENAPILSPWKTLTSLNVFIDPSYSPTGRVHIEGINRRRQSFRFSIDRGANNGFIQFFAGGDLRYEQRHYKKGSLLTFLLSKDDAIASDSYFSIAPKTTQVFCPIFKGQIVCVILPEGSRLELHKGGGMCIISRSKSPFMNMECYFLYCMEDLTSNAYALVETVTDNFSGVTLDKAKHCAILFSPARMEHDDLVVDLDNPLGTFTFIRNRCTGFVIRHKQASIETRVKFLDKTKRLRVLRTTVEVEDCSKVHQIAYDAPRGSQLELIVKNLYSNGCEAI